MKKKYILKTDRGVVEWTDRNSPLLIKTVAGLVWPTSALITNLKVGNASMLKGLLKRGDRAVLLSSQPSGFDPITVSGFCVSQLGQPPRHIGMSGLPRWFERFGYIPVDRQADVYRTLQTHGQLHDADAKRRVQDEAALRKKLVYHQIVPNLLECGEIMNMFPQGSVNLPGNPKRLKMGPLKNIIESSRRVRGNIDVYGFPLRVSYSKTPQILKVAGKTIKAHGAPVILPPPGGNVYVEVTEPIKLNDKSSSLYDHSCRVHAHVASQLEGLVG